MGEEKKERVEEGCEEDEELAEGDEETDGAGGEERGPPGKEEKEQEQEQEQEEEKQDEEKQEEQKEQEEQEMRICTLVHGCVYMFVPLRAHMCTSCEFVLVFVVVCGVCMCLVVRFEYSPVCLFV